MPAQPIKLFISHASEDKKSFVKSLALSLRANPLFDLWYDEYSLRLGDSLSKSIAKGLRSCDYGVVVISPAFISKQWPANELAGLFALETKERTVLLPIWHKVTRENVLKFSPILADRIAIPSTKPLGEIVFAIEFAAGISQRIKEASYPIAKIRKGLSINVYKSVKADLAMTDLEMAEEVLHIPMRTLTRRLGTKKIFFTTVESDRLARVAEILKQAQETFLSAAEARDWMKTPLKAFDGETPLRRMDTSVGASQVADVLARIYKNSG